jgi:hypothetical protein
MYVASLFSAWNNVEETNAGEATKDLGREAPIRYYLMLLPIKNLPLFIRRVQREAKDPCVLVSCLYTLDDVVW